MTTPADCECICGAIIRWVTLPDDLAALSGRTGFWSHIDNRDDRCYPDTPGMAAAKAEPYQGGT
jgi:hypothetical protein